MVKLTWVRTWTPSVYQALIHEDRKVKIAFVHSEGVHRYIKFRTLPKVGYFQIAAQLTDNLVIRRYAITELENLEKWNNDTDKNKVGSSGWQGVN